MACSYCGREKKIAAKGLCSACYCRARYRGSMERINTVNQGQTCLVDGCGKLAFAKGMCSPHYNRAQHPLKTVWKLLRSRAGEGNYPASWDRFDTFLKDVGERPSRRHQLRRLDTRKPYSLKNVHWLAPLGKADCYTPEQRSFVNKAWNLRQRFGLSTEDYAQKLKEQNSVCAICKQPETAKNRGSKVIRSLAVDHCHVSGDNRGLLCNNCNRLLGIAKDDPTLLRKAIAYLERHQN